MSSADCVVAVVPSKSAPAFPVVITVPVASGKVIVLSPVGSATVRVVSCASAVAPSKRSVLPVFRKRPSFLILATISFEPAETTANSISPSSAPAVGSSIFPVIFAYVWLAPPESSPVNFICPR